MNTCTALCHLCLLSGRKPATPPPVPPEYSTVTPPPDRRVYSEDQLRTGAGVLDAAAVAAVLAGDSDVFRVLVERYRDSFARFAVRMLGNADDADDVLQSAFVRAFRNIGSCQDPRRF